MKKIIRKLSKDVFKRKTLRNAINAALAALAAKMAVDAYDKVRSEKGPNTGQP